MVMRRVLITGAAGFIGRHCLAPLLDRGFEVHALAQAFAEQGKRRFVGAGEALAESLLSALSDESALRDRARRLEALVRQRFLW